MDVHSSQRMGEDLGAGVSEWTVICLICICLICIGLIWYHAETQGSRGGLSASPFICFIVQSFCATSFRSSQVVINMLFAAKFPPPVPILCVWRGSPFA
jgi:hypothetical protein